MVIKPAVGVADFASNVTEGQLGCIYIKQVLTASSGFRNTTTMFDPPTQDRVRQVCIKASFVCCANSLEQPRHVPFDGVLGTYSAREAIGQTWMREVDRGHFKRDLYVAHIGESRPNRAPHVVNQIHLWSRRRDPRWRQRCPHNDFSYHLVLLGQAPLGLVP